MAVLLCLLTSCATTVNDPALLRVAQQTVSIQTALMPLWQEGVSGADAVIIPENFTLHGEPLSLHAVYRRTDGGSDQAKFALFLPQGLKLGQCVRTADSYRCSKLPLPGTDELLSAAFASLDEIYRLKPDGTDRLTLMRHGKETCIKRMRRQQDAVYSLTYDSNGTLRTAAKETASADVSCPAAAGWNVIFSDDPAQYRFTQAGSGLQFGVRIIGVRKKS